MLDQKFRQVCIGPVVGSVFLLSRFLRLLEYGLGLSIAAHRLIAQCEVVRRLVIIRIKRDQPAKHLNGGREIVLSVIDAAQVIEGFSVVGVLLVGDGKFALRRDVLLVEE